MNRCAVIGIGQTKHAAKRDDLSITGLVREAALRALEDAGLTFADIDAVVIGKAPDFFEGIMMPELFLADALGAAGKPMMRVHTAGSVGGSTAVVASHLITSGVHDRVLVVAFEKQSESDAMWALSPKFPFQPPLMAGAGGYFAPLVRSYIRLSGAPLDCGIRVAVKDRKNALKNPYAHLQLADISEASVAASPLLWDPIRYLETCPSSDGACAVVLASEKGAKGIERPAWVLGTEVRSEPSMFSGRDQVNPQAGRDCAAALYKKAGIQNPRKEIDVAEVYVPFSWFEPMWMENLGFAEKHQGWRMTMDGMTALDGDLPINASGGVLSTNPIGASGLLRFAEAALQVRGRAGEHQVDGARVAMGHAYGGASQFFAMWLVGSERPLAPRRTLQRTTDTSDPGDTGTMEFNIADLFESIADAVPDRVALVSGDKVQTFAQLDERANRLANALAARGVTAGSHVGLYLYNGAEFVEAMLACFKLRAVGININYRYVEDELAYLYRNADLVALVQQRELGGRTHHVRDQVPTLKSVITVEDGSDVDMYGAEPYEDVVKSGSPERRFGPRSGDDIYMIYTGGTTGMPRGVMWRHEDVFFAGLQGGNPGGEAIRVATEVAPAAAERTDPMVILPAAPFIHGAAQWAAWIAILSGGRAVVAPGRSFEPAKVLELVEREKVLVLNLVGDAMARPFVDALRANEGKRDISSLMVVSSAGAILSESVKNELSELLSGAMVLNSFGATETGHQGTIYPGGEAGGRPSFYMDESNTVLGEDDKPITPGSGVMGRLARRGRLPVGYYKDPAKTAATFLTIDGQRWVVPGDMATLEEDGRITVFGRGAMCINSGGEKVFPEEVEEALKAHPDVVDAVVVGLPDERWGQRVTAVVQTRPGADFTLAKLDAHCRTKVAGYKVPRELHLVPTMQRHPSGKPDYRWAREIALGQAISP